jgi:hypothetical protein
MQQWLKDNGITKKMIPLTMFDYLTKPNSFRKTQKKFSRTICFAGNLTKSTFIYHLNQVTSWHFNVYGPNFQREKISGSNTTWGGEFSPEQIASELEGDFGLIWDGIEIDKCDKILGNYLRYNNPHKFSLYLAAGLPVIAPLDSAIADLIKEYKIGILVGNLKQLDNIEITDSEYNSLRQNCVGISNKVISGEYLLDAIDLAEKELRA